MAPYGSGWCYNAVRRCSPPPSGGSHSSRKHVRVSDTAYEQQRKLAYYQAVVDAGIGTLMERDRTLVSLSAGGLALLAGLLTAVGPASLCESVLYGLAAIAFLAAVGIALWIYRRNAVHLERLAHSADPAFERDDALRTADCLLTAAFVTGVLSTLALAGVSATERAQERTMKRETRAPVAGIVHTVAPPADVRQSLETVGKFAPKAATEAKAPADPAPAATDAPATPAAESKSPAPEPAAGS